MFPALEQDVGLEKDMHASAMEVKAMGLVKVKNTLIFVFWNLLRLFSFFVLLA
jgi:hypothetical protein